MDDDIDFNFPKRAQNASMGRRARQNQQMESASPQVEANTSVTNQSPSAADNFSVDAPKRRVGGWGDDEILSTPPLTANKSKSGRRRGEDTIISTGFTNFDDDGDSDPDIPVIPELEDSGGDSSAVPQMAMAPSVAVNKVTSYKELDSDLQRSSQFSMLDGEIDLKLLSRCLVAQEETKSADKLWDWDHLFTEVSSELLSEWESPDPEQPQTSTSTDIITA